MNKVLIVGNDRILFLSGKIPDRYILLMMFEKIKYMSRFIMFI